MPGQEGGSSRGSFSEGVYPAPRFPKEAHVIGVGGQITSEREPHGLICYVRVENDTLAESIAVDFAAKPESLTF